MRFTVVGAGGIGATVGAYLARGGEDVTLVDIDSDHVAEMNRAGLTLETPDGPLLARPRAITPDLLEGNLEAVLLAVRATDTETAVTGLLPHLGPESFIVSLQNGLNEPVIARLAGVGRTVGAFINFSAEYIEPGLVRFWGTGPFCLGELDGRPSPRVKQLAATLERHWGPVTITANVFGYLWAKEAYGNMLIPCRLVDADQADACERRPRLLIELATEFIEVAEAEGERLESFNSFEPHLYYPRSQRDQEALRQSFAAMVDYMRRRQKPRPGSYRRVPGYGQPEPRPGIEHRLAIGRRHDLEMPLTRLALAAADRQAGSKAGGWELVDRLDDDAERLYG